MIFRVTTGTKIKKLFVSKYSEKENVLIMTKTYWFFIIPIITVEMSIS